MHLDIRPLRTVGWVFGECHHNLALKQSACGIGVPHGLGISGPPVSVHTCNTPPRPPSHPSQQQAEPWSHHFSTCPTWWRAGLLSGWSWEVEGQCQCPPTPGGGKCREGGVGSGHPGLPHILASRSLASQLGTCSTVTVPWLCRPRHGTSCDRSLVSSCLVIWSPAVLALERKRHGARTWACSYCVLRT